MTLDPKSLEGLDPPDAKFLEIIDRFGWHVMSVAPRVGEDGDIFSYSTGLFLRLGQPEMILCGLDSETSTHIINEIGSQLQSGRVFETNRDYDDIFANGVKCQFRPVLVAHYHLYVCWSQWFYEGNDFPVWQCFWPDAKGYFPWETDCHASVARAQPLLYRPPVSVM